MYTAKHLALFFHGVLLNEYCRITQRLWVKMGLCETSLVGDRAILAPYYGLHWDQLMISKVCLRWLWIIKCRTPVIWLIYAVRQCWGLIKVALMIQLWLTFNISIRIFNIFTSISVLHYTTSNPFCIFLLGILISDCILNPQPHRSIMLQHTSRLMSCT